METEGSIDGKMNDYFLHLPREVGKPLNCRWRDFCRLMRYCRIIPFINNLLASLLSIQFRLEEFLETDTILKITDFSATYNEAIVA